jgi:hypothetical protein
MSSTPPTPEQYAEMQRVFDAIEQEQEQEPTEVSAREGGIDLGQAMRALVASLQPLPNDWTTRQAAATFAAWKPLFIMQQAFGALDAAIRQATFVAGKDAVVQAAYQLEGAYRALFYEALKPQDRHIATLRQRQRDGRKAKGVSKHDWNALCQEYDALHAQRVSHATIITTIAKRRKIRRDVLSRGFKQRGHPPCNP